MPVFVVDVPGRLDRFLAERVHEHSRSKLARLIGEGVVRVDGLPRKPGFRVKPGMVVVIAEVGDSEPHKLEPVEIPISVVYEDAELLVVDKPRGLASHPAPSQRSWTLVNALLARGHALSGVAGAYRPGIVHRLDRDTTGLLMVAKTDAAHWRLAEQIRSKTAERRYACVVKGWPTQERFTVNAPIGLDPHHRKRRSVRPDGKPAVTHFLRVARLDEGALMVAHLETGRTHQIRVHASAIGHPVLGDRVYAPQTAADVPLQLHAGYLAFDHPSTGERLSFFAAPPYDFLGALWVTREVLATIDPRR